MNISPFRSILITLSLGILIAVLCLLFQLIFDGDYRFALISNMLVFAISGYILRKKISGTSLLLGLVFLSLPYGIYYYTQIEATPLIVIFPIFNLIAVLIGYFFHWEKSNFKSMTKMCFVVVMIVLFGWFIIPMFSINSGKKITDRKVPYFEVTSLDGEKLRSSDFNGKIMIVDFWATWCIPCVAELEELETFYSQIKERDDVVFLAINEDNGGNLELAKMFVKKRGLDLPMYVDSLSTTYNAFQAYSFPALYLIDGKGNIRWMSLAYNPSDNITAKLFKKIAEIKAE